MILNEKLCKKCNTIQPIAMFGINNKLKSGLATYCKPCYRVVRNDWKNANPELAKEINRRTRLKNRESGVIFELTVAMLPPIPEFCPALGIKLQKSDGPPTSNSPSLDRLIPALGYVEGNVRWISWRANTIKSDATADELRRIADWIDSQGTH